MQEISGTLGYKGRPPVAAVLLEFVDSAGEVVSAALPNRDGDFSLLSQRDDVASLRVLVDGKHVKTVPLPPDPTKVAVTLPAQVSRAPAPRPKALLDMAATRRWIAPLARLGAKRPDAAQAAEAASRIAQAARVAAEHDLETLSDDVLAGRAGAAEELEQILARVPPLGPPSAPRVTGSGPAS